MAELLKFTSKFRLNGPIEPPPGKVTKRPRLVCNQCKKAKVRCDRGLPCGSCMKRDDGISCSYQQQITASGGRNAFAEDKLQHLESLVTQLIKSQTSMAPNNLEVPVTSESSSDSHHVDHASRDLVVETPAATETYVGSTHWSSMLEDIHELKAALAGSSEISDEQLSTSPGALELNQELIFGVPGDYSLGRIIFQFLPPKIEVDRYLSRYFQGETYIVPFIHTYQFQHQYREFWADKSKVSPLWLSMLFSICHMASLFGRNTGSPYSPQRMSSNGNYSLHTAAGQCLVLGQYHRPQKFGVEALALYGQCKNLLTLDPSQEVGTILSMIVRMSYGMGYHRDPDSVGNFTVFEGEMRRRFWASIKQMDLMTCFQLGLPSNVNLEHCDTKSPRNLLDSDFDEDTITLPTSRSENEYSKLLWFIVKERQAVSFSKVCQDALSFKEKSESEIIELDADIREMYASIPNILQARPMAESITDEPFLIMTRIYLHFIYLKSLCVLHRKYMARGVDFSTLTCVDAGMKLVRQFIEMNDEFAPGGQLHDQRWMLTNFTVNDFLLGNMVLSLAVHSCKKRDTGMSPINMETRKEVVELLQRSYSVCFEIAPVSKDALRVSHIIRLTLNRASAKASDQVVDLPSQKFPGISTTSILDSSTVDGVTEPAGQTISILPPWQSCMPSDDATFGAFDYMDFNNNESEGIDWMALDQCFGTQDISS
ncbi:hypothetical protein ONS95_004549 [Cadophora gregata]|uniref:uncharacterized protein n=1 Tax=Cadophora gregata TaxID=51156 RepID=UPI0026DBB95C|nr:uncharacterized protein ONS95_004549 [Cadophora gregata]KAK0105088.1 hypothetical protein ONS96_004491 [Cadophora gregata f. sp. sojae]KAK0106043.1 hypothetical protein ONS95_004549 [Cadophora gregata]